MKLKRKLTRGNKWFRKELNLLWDALYRWTPVQPLAGWAETESGLLPYREPKHIPKFSPVLDGTTTKTLYIHPGYLNAPKSTTAANEIPDYYLFPYMPQVATVALDDPSPNGLTLTDSSTNYVYMPITWTVRDSPIGATTVGTPPSDQTGVFVLESGGGTGAAVLSALTYHIDESNWPSFLVTTTGFPISSEGANTLVANIPWGKFLMDADGEVTSYEWYWSGCDRDIHPPVHIMGGKTPDSDGGNPS